MKRIGLLIGCLALVAMLLPALTAQDEKKKDADKAAKKDVDKKDDKKEAVKKDEKKEAGKKTDKKDEDKKDDEKKKPEPKKAPEKLVYGAKFTTKIVAAKADSNREYTIEVQEIDPKKVFDLNRWKAERSQQLAQQQFNISNIDAKDVQGRFNAIRQYKQDVYNFNVDAAKRATQVYTAKQVEVRATEKAKVRSIFPPVEFDDQTGFQKKFTKKELDERRDKTGLPGFPVEFDAIKAGQTVEIYMVKQAPPTKKKKGPDDEDVQAMPRQEFVLIVIMQEAK